jgi:hypothetical protein
MCFLKKEIASIRPLRHGTAHCASQAAARLRGLGPICRYRFKDDAVLSHVRMDYHGNAGGGVPT